MSYRPDKIVSGGQAGADRAGLDWAIEHGIPHGGFCPKGRLAEDGVIPSQYDLVETPSSEYAERTDANVRATDVTLILILHRMGRGSRLTQQLCERYAKPYLVVDSCTNVETVGKFLASRRPRILNIAGSRASDEPSISARVREILDAVIDDSDQPDKRMNDAD
jgi:hypothetical protein